MSLQENELPVPADLISSDNAARSLLAKCQLSEADACLIIRRTCEGASFLSQIGFQKSTNAPCIQVEPAAGKQGDFSYTTFIVIKNAEQKQLVAQFRAHEDQTNNEVLQQAVSVFQDYVAILLCVVMEYPLQLTITQNYGDTYEQKSRTFSFDQKRNAIRHCAEFLVMGCTQSNRVGQTHSSLADRFREITGWNFERELALILQSLAGKLRILSLSRASLIF